MSITRAAANRLGRGLGISVGLTWAKAPDGVTFISPRIEIRRFTTPREAVRFLMDFASSIESIWLLKDAIL
jgi:hypothetical protein